jgi:poly(3-hydroxybutyrate) depolymerase
MHKTILALVPLLACTTVVEQPISYRPCDPTSSSTTAAETSSGTDSSSSDGGSSSSTGGLVCPTIVDGQVSFDLPVAGVSRVVWFDGVAEATGTGPAVVALHGTYEGALNGAGQPNFLLYNPGVDMNSMATAQGGILLAPFEDVAAEGDGEPFPWWNVCGILGMSCTRDDDGELVELAVACSIEQGLADPERAVIGGMSAGGIQTSLAVMRGLGDITIAAAVSWSGGTPAMFQPTIAASAATSVFALHGGTNDTYCGVGQPAGSCNGYEPYHFDAPSELMASQLDDAGNFAFVCNHGGGHNAQMGPQGAEFLSVARADEAHPWLGFPFGVDEYGQWPQMSGGTNWMLRFFGDCHDPA